MTDIHHIKNTEKTDGHTVSVIIPTIERSTLPLTNHALVKQTRKPDEVIVIKDLKHLGSSWARNQGIEKAKGDVIAFLDDDCIPPSFWLESLINALDRYQADGVGGSYREIDPLFDDIGRRRGYPKKVIYDAGQWVGVGGNVMYTKRILDILYQKQGYYFNEKSMMVQDFELALQLLIMGAKFVYVPVDVIHLRRTTITKFLKVQFGRGTGIARLYQIKRQQNNISPKFQKSLLWGEKGNSNKPKWIKIFIFKVLGPFDVKSFRSFRNFIFFWLGEKFQGVGFLSEKLRKKQIDF